MKRKKRYRASYGKRMQGLIICLQQMSDDDDFFTEFQMMPGFISLELPNPRACRAYEREESWWQELWAHRFDENYHGGHRWKQDFRMKANESELLQTRGHSNAIPPKRQKKTRYVFFPGFFRGYALSKRRCALRE